MLALGIGVILLILFGAVVRSGLAIGAVAVLTSLVSLPGAVGTLLWIAAGGYTLLNILGAGIALSALISAGSASKPIGGITPPPRRRRIG